MLNMTKTVRVTHCRAQMGWAGLALVREEADTIV